MDIESEFHALVAALEGSGLDYAVVGGFAVAVWGAPRATTDIDLLVRREDVDALLQLAERRGFTFVALPMKFDDGMEVRRVTRLESGEALTLDLLVLNENLVPIWNSRRRVQTGAGPLSVISREALIQMKLLAGRPQDLGDVARLTDMDR